MYPCRSRRSRATAGGDYPARYERMVEMMMQHAAVTEGEEVDAANLAMFLWSLRRRGE